MNEILTVAAAIAVPVLVVAGSVLSCFATRYRVATAPGAFRCKVRVVKVPLAGAKLTWPRNTAHGVWVHDTLVVVSGILRAHVCALPVAFAEGDVRRASEDVGVGLGYRPLTLTLRLDDGSRAFLAAPNEARSTMAGPYLVAQLAVTRRTRSNDSTARTPKPDQP